MHPPFFISAWLTNETADHIPSNLLKAVFHKKYLVHSWILCPKQSSEHTTDMMYQILNIRVTFLRGLLKLFIIDWSHASTINSNGLHIRMAAIGILLNLKIWSARHDKGVLIQIDKLAIQNTLGIAKSVQLKPRRSSKHPLEILISRQKIVLTFH